MISSKRGSRVLLPIIRKCPRTMKKPLDEGPRFRISPYREILRCRQHFTGIGKSPQNEGLCFRISFYRKILKDEPHFAEFKVMFREKVRAVHVIDLAATFHIVVDMKARTFANHPLLSQSRYLSFESLLLADP